MRLRAGILCFVCMVLACSGCDQSFTPKVQTGNRYFVYCIISATPRGSGAQVALVDRMYDVEGLNPSANTVDPFVHGARLTFGVRGKLYPFVPDTTARRDTTRYNTPVYSYVLTGITVVALDAVTLRVVLPDSTVLTGSTVMPPYRPTSSTPEFPSGVTTLVDRENEGDAWILDWEGVATEEHLFFPRLSLAYSIVADSVTTYHSASVPLRYVQSGGGSVPVYATVQSGTSIRVELDALDRFVQQIGEGVAVKSNVHLQRFVFDILEYDTPLSRYYSSVNGYMDEFSVRLDERTYTNVQGGDGIFGAAYTSSYTYSVERHFAAKFGYSTP
jgi:hypothetical protein